MRSPLNSRRNNRPERVAPDEAFVLVSWSTVMVLSFRVPLLDPNAPQLPVKLGKSRQIVANETAVPRTSIQVKINGASAAGRAGDGLCRNLERLT
jgi:hypothetical protein